MSIDTQLREAILRQVRLSPALLTVAMQVDLEVSLDQALATAARAHRVEQIDLSIMWTEMVLRNSQSIISRPWRQRR